MRLTVEVIDRFRDRTLGIRYELADPRLGHALDDLRTAVVTVATHVPRRERPRAAPPRH